MGKSKRFIAKGEGETFHLLHRSHTDKAHAGEENPSNFVLVPVNTNTKSSSSKRVSFGEFEDVVKGRGAERRDHINALGFKNDGYDYSQHLKEMGGGLFVGRDGAVRKLDNTEAVRSSLQLPEEALPSMGEELVRDLNAITISDECMDDDIREALFGDDDALEGFEELQDDFVAQVMQEPEVPDFDFDAHIAALIARSEQMALGGVSKVAPRGWGKPGKLSNGEEYVDEDDDDDIDMGEDEDGMSVSVSSSMRRLRLGRAVRRGAGEVLSAEEQALIDEEFEKTLQEYDEQEIGGLDDGYFEGDEDESVSDGRSLLSSSCVGGGGIDVAGSNPTFNRALDDFLQVTS